jgi:hypothetical protein
MSIRLASYAVLPALLVAGGFAFYGAGRAPEPTTATADNAPHLATGADDLPPDDLPPEDGRRLPPNHPPIGARTSPLQSPASAEDDPPALVWTIPERWKEAPSPTSHDWRMRLATYRAPGDVETSVSRAGGTTEANIQRWIAQFDDVGRENRVEQTVRGLHVVTVDVTGTYVGGGPAMGGPAEAKHDWAMVAAIVEGPRPPYFFKMTGSAPAVRAARPAFERLLGSISPK